MRKLSLILQLVLTFLFLTAGIAAAETMEIGLAWAGKSGMADRVADGFDKGMQELAPDIKIERQKDLASVEDLAALAGKWQKEKKAMVLLRSNAAKWIGKNPPLIPTFIGGCNNPSELGAVKNLQAPEGKITGVTYFLPVDTQFEIFKAIIPNLKSVALLVEKNHPSSLIDREGTKDVCKKLNIQYNEVLCASKEEAVQAANQYKGKVSAIILGNQALLIDNAEPVVGAAGKTPVVSYSSKPVKAGALGGFVADDAKLGYLLAQSVVEVLKKGKSINSVPVKVDPDPKFYVNAKTAENLGIEIPYSILESASVIQ